LIVPETMLRITVLVIRIEPPLLGFWVLMIQSRKPSQKSRPASVTTNEASRSRVIRKPWMIPISAVAPSPAGRRARGPWP